MPYIKFVILIVLIPIYFSITILLPNSMQAQSGWYQVSSPASGPLKGIYFRDSNTGIIIGYKTTNGGQNWFSTNGGYGNALSFPNPNTGYVVGTVFSKTTNFGDNWISIPTPSTGGYGVFFPNVNTGYVIGGLTKIFKTTSAGYNWIDISPIFYNYNYHYAGISFPDTSLGFVVGSSVFTDTSIILKTTNGGINWETNYFFLPSGKYLQSIFMLNSNTGFVGGASILFITTNSGSTWEFRLNPTLSVINCIYFPSYNTGYGVCSFGDIIKTTDGGDTWLRQTPVTGYDLYTVFFPNDNTGFACGQNGTVLKTTNGGGPPIGIKPIGKEIPKSFSLSQNYPNPFNPSTRIRYQLPISSNVVLKVYDLLGKEVAVLVNEKQAAGIYEVEWQASSYPSGVYFYRLTAGDYHETKRMVLIK